MCAARRPSTKPLHPHTHFASNHPLRATTTFKNAALLNGVMSIGQPKTDLTSKNDVQTIPAFGQTFVPPAAPDNKLYSFSFYWNSGAANAGHNVQAVRGALQKSSVCGLLYNMSVLTSSCPPFATHGSISTSSTRPPTWYVKGARREGTLQAEKWGAQTK